MSSIRRYPSKWSEKENETLIDLVKKYGNHDWKQISQELGGRTGKQCRERWFNHLNPALVRAPWTTEEEDKLISLQFKHGTHWSRIAQEFNHRSDNDIKNRWACLQRRKDFPQRQAIVFEVQTKRDSMIQAEKKAKRYEKSLDHSVVSVDLTQTHLSPTAQKRLTSLLNMTPKTKLHALASVALMTPRVTAEALPTLKKHLESLVGDCISIEKTQEESPLPSISTYSHFYSYDSVKMMDEDDKRRSPTSVCPVAACPDLLDAEPGWNRFECLYQAACMMSSSSI